MKISDFAVEYLNEAVSSSWLRLEKGFRSVRSTLFFFSQDSGYELLPVTSVIIIIYDKQ